MKKNKVSAIFLVGFLALYQDSYSMLSELKYPVFANLSKKDLEYRMGESIFLEVDHHKIRSKKQSDKPYAHCVHYALAKNSGLQEDFLFLAGENECTSIHFEKYYKQVPFEKAHKGNLVFYISSITYPAIQHAGILHEKSDSAMSCLVESQQGASNIVITHQLFANHLDHGKIVVFLQPKDDFSLEQMRYDNEIMQCKVMRDYKNYKKKFDLSLHNCLRFQLKQYNNELKELDWSQIQRLSLLYKILFDHVTNIKGRRNTVSFLEHTMLKLKACIIEKTMNSALFLKDTEIEDIFSQVFKS